MRRHSRRIIMAIGFASAGGILLSGPGSGCTSYVGETGLLATNFCFIFDCSQNGILGGTLNPCAQSVGPDGNIQPPVFLDCPESQGP